MPGKAPTSSWIIDLPIAPSSPNISSGSSAYPTLGSISWWLTKHTQRIYTLFTFAYHSQLYISMTSNSMDAQLSYQDRYQEIEFIKVTRKGLNLA